MNRHPTQPTACGLAPSAPPSRYANPFATCWTRPGALAYRFAAGQSAERLVARLAALNWQGAIIGPHGSGKSTLLEALKPALRAAGCKPRSITLRARRADVFNHWYQTTKLLRMAHSPKRLVLIVDGYEQLGWFARLRLLRHCRRRNLGLLVTSHSLPAGLPLLVQLEPDRQLVEQLVAELAGRVSTPVTKADVAASHACFGSNVREILFDLYDRHERLRRGGCSDGFGRP